MSTLAAAGMNLAGRQVGELVLAFALSSAIGLERQFRGKSAGLRTQAIVGTASALILLVSKYGFGDVLVAGQVVLDPSRVAAQIVSGIGFLGAGLIITRRGAIRGLTTAASVWETAAIGMAAGAGLVLLALVVTVLHFVIVFVYTPIGRRVSTYSHRERTYTITYEDGRGVLREILSVCTAQNWAVRSLAVLQTDRSVPGSLVTIAIGLEGVRAADAPSTLATIDGLVRIDHSDEFDE